MYYGEFENRELKKKKILLRVQEIVLCFNHYFQSRKKISLFVNSNYRYPPFVTREGWVLTVVMTES